MGKAPAGRAAGTAQEHGSVRGSQINERLAHERSSTPQRITTCKDRPDRRPWRTALAASLPVAGVPTAVRGRRHLGTAMAGTGVRSPTMATRRRPWRGAGGAAAGEAGAAAKDGVVRSAACPQERCAGTGG